MTAFSMNLRGVWLLVAVLAGSCSIGLAGEPIRFVRPKVGERAPLRVNFAAEKIQSREALTAASLQPSSSSSSPRMVGGGMVVNRRGRPTGLNRHSWSSGQAATSAGPEPAAMRREMAETTDLAPARSRSDGSVFSSEGLMPRGPGSGQPPVPERSSINDNRAALRSIGLGIDPLGSSGTSARSSVPDGVGAGPSGSLPGYPAGLGADLRRDAASGLGSGTPGVGSAPAPRSGLESGFGASPINLPAAAPADPRRPVFDPGSRPLRSSFDLPSRRQ